ncbi:MAG: glycoside hydrolase family 43 protein [Acidimicrobiia bacterium]|nr:glycoside hydrolase family 43 protein [Acidimicrobiia bacterium]
MYSKNSADPSVVVDAGGGYHAFSTGRQFTGNYPHYSSTDLSEFTYTMDAMPDMPAWAGGYPVAWAPDVEQFGSTWVMYFTARHYASGRQCIGVAESPTIDGPYDADESGPLVCTGSPGGSGGAIDASVFVDDDGSAYLLWKNDGNCCGTQTAIWIQRLAADGLSLTGSAIKLIERDQAWENGNAYTAPDEPYKTLIEAPVMVRNAGGQYHLLYSGNWWASPYYAIGRARCISPTGPCLKTTLNPIVAADGPVAGPGGPDVFVDAVGQTWLGYHGWNASRVTTEDGGKRSLRIDRLTFPNDTPTTDAPTAGPRPVVDGSGASTSGATGAGGSGVASSGVTSSEATGCLAPGPGARPTTGPAISAPQVPGSVAIDTGGLAASAVASDAGTSWVVLREPSIVGAADSGAPPSVVWLGRVDDPAAGINALTPVVAGCDVTALTADGEGAWLATCAVTAPVGSTSGAEILHVGKDGEVDTRIAVPTRCVDSIDASDGVIAVGWSGLVDEPAGVWTLDPASGAVEAVDTARGRAARGGVNVSDDGTVTTATAAPGLLDTSVGASGGLVPEGRSGRAHRHRRPLGSGDRETPRLLRLRRWTTRPVGAPARRRHRRRRQWRLVSVLRRARVRPGSLIPVPGSPVSAPDLHPCRVRSTWVLFSAAH